MICPYCNSIMIKHNQYFDCSGPNRLKTHLTFFSNQEFYLFIADYKIGKHFKGPTFYFGPSHTYKTQIIPPFLFQNIHSTLQKYIKLTAFL